MRRFPLIAFLAVAIASTVGWLFLLGTGIWWLILKL
jgi:hypothetical protein